MTMTVAAALLTADIMLMHAFSEDDFSVLKIRTDAGVAAESAHISFRQRIAACALGNDCLFAHHINRGLRNHADRVLFQRPAYLDGLPLRQTDIATDAAIGSDLRVSCNRHVPTDSHIATLSIPHIHTAGIVVRTSADVIGKGIAANLGIFGHGELATVHIHARCAVVAAGSVVISAVEGGSVVADFGVAAHVERTAFVHTHAACTAISACIVVFCDFTAVHFKCTVFHMRTHCSIPGNLTAVHVKATTRYQLYAILSG